MTNATADFERADFPVKQVIDGNLKTHWFSDAGNVRRNQDRKMVFATTQPVGSDSGTTFNFQLAQKYDETVKIGNVMPNIGRFRISVTTAANPKADPLPTDVRRLLAVPTDKRTQEQQRRVFSYYRTTVSEFDEANKQIDELLKDWPYGVTTLALSPRNIQRETHIFRRGDWKRPTDVVTPDTPAALPPFPANAPRNRLGLAQWIVAKNNPLTARVNVNRIWQSYFGVGLVTTPEDFGARCERPSHPELLDWLATEFVGRGWSMKQMHRLMMTSQAYQMASDDTAANVAIDPENRLFWRMPRVRLEAEIIRDAILAVAGNLNRSLGGPAIYPYIDPNLFQSSTKRTWPGKPDDDPATWRRSLYVYSKRSIRYPLFETFDQPNLINSCERRNRSTIAPQALLLMNNNFVLTEAKFFAERLRKDAGDDTKAQIERAFRLVYSRAPQADEKQSAMAFLKRQDGITGNRKTSMVDLCHMLLNSNEFLYIN